MRRYSSRGYVDEYDGGQSSRRTERQKSLPSNYESRSSTKPFYEDGGGDDEFDQEIKVTRDFDPVSKRGTSDDDRYKRDKRKVSTPVPKPQPRFVIIDNLTNIDLPALVFGAPPNSVKQTIEVDRLDDELLYSLPPGRYPSWARPRRLSSTGDNGTSSPLDEYDKVDEFMEMDLEEGGTVLLCHHVKSEKISPILGSEEMFKKSSMVVTRRIKVDLKVTPTRQSLYELILDVQRERGVYDKFSTWKQRSSVSGGMAGLRKEENAELSRVLMGLADVYKMI